MFIYTYSDSLDDTVNAQIQDVVSQYFLNLNKFDRIPKSDLVQVISNISDIYSVEISFMCKKDEDYHNVNKITDQNRYNQFASQSNLSLVRPNPNYDPNASLGLDPVVGDILFDPNEIPVIRGGWYDRNQVYYSDDINESGLKSLNIIKKGTIDPSHRTKI